MKEEFKILIVDDDLKYCQTLRDILEQGGFSVDEAYDGDEACEIMKKKHYNLIFMDIEMPNLDGFLSSTVIRVKNPEIEVVFITGYAKNEKINRILETIPRSSWFMKPVNPEEILKIATRISKQAVGKGDK